MKILVASDIHGSLPQAKNIIRIFNEEKADKLFILGDLYYHGPRNPLPEGYAPMKAAELFNVYADKITAVRGNCDARVDSYISNFPFVDSIDIEIGGKEIFMSHGDEYNKDNPPDINKGGIDIYGHFHINEIVEKDGITHICISSPSLPKQNAAPAYAVIDDKYIKVISIDNNSLIFEKSLK